MVPAVSALFRDQPLTWRGIADARLQIHFYRSEPADELISNVKVIGRYDHGIVVLETEQGWRSVSGGSREPGESLRAAADREAREEVGGQIVGELAWVGAFRVDHSVAGPHRPHLPCPISYWAYVVADLEFVQERDQSIGRRAGYFGPRSSGRRGDRVAVCLRRGPLLEVIKLANELGQAGSYQRRSLDLDATARGL